MSTISTITQESASDMRMTRVEKVLKEKRKLQDKCGLVFVHPDSPAGRKAISQAYGPCCGNENILALHNGKLYSTVERTRYIAGDRWFGRLEEHAGTDDCDTLEMCIEAICQRYREELASGEIDRLVEERWHTPDMTTEEVEELLSKSLKEMFGDDYLNILDNAIKEMNESD